MSAGGAPGSATLREGRDAYFAANGMPPDGGYSEDWVKTRLGPIPFAYPNSAGRKRIVAAHDLHHVLTGYATHVLGEGELAAWEIGAGCRDRTGLQLQLRVLGFALVGAPRRMFRAFVRGRRCRHLLETPVDDTLLARRIDEVRAELGLAAPEAPADAADRRAFSGWALAALGVVWGPLIPIGLLVWWLAF